MKRLTRQRLGEKFSEASRLLWQMCLASSQEAVGVQLGLARGQISKLVYGDSRPGTVIALRAQRLLGIPVEAWLEEPSLPFTLPALLQDERSEHASSARGTTCGR